MKRIINLLILLQTLSVISALSAQSLWVNHLQGNYFALEIFKPNFDSDFIGESDLSFASSVVILTGWYVVSENFRLVGELPFAHGSIDEVGESETETIIGNVYIGLEFRKPNAPVFTEFGIRPPLAAEEKIIAPIIGIISEFDRLEAFLPDIITLSGKVNYYQQNSSKMIFWLRGGPTAWLNSDDFVGDDSEIWMDYSAQIGYEGEQFRLMGGLTGRMIVTQDGIDFGDRFINQLTATASAKLGRVQPGILFRLPLDDDFFLNFVDFIFGFNLGVQLR
ncbi:MAG: hypothetical protein ACE5HS_01785 [bacterium]